MEYNRTDEDLICLVHLIIVRCIADGADMRTRKMKKDCWVLGS